MQVYAFVDRLDDNGMVIEWKQTIGVTQRVASVKDGVRIPEKSTELTPKLKGLFIFPGRPTKEEAAALKSYADRHNVEGQPPRLIGPYPDVEKALIGKFEHRPKTPAEALALAQAEIAALKAGGAEPATDEAKAALVEANTELARRVEALEAEKAAAAEED